MNLVFEKKTVFRRKTVFQRVVYLVAGLALILDALALVDFVLHPLAADHTFHSTLYRGITVLVLLPLNLLVAYLVIKRVPGNIVGPLLIVWTGSIAYQSMREEIWFAAFSLGFAYDILFGWLGLFLMFLHFPDGKIISPKIARWVYRLLLIIMPMVILTVTSMKVIPGSTRYRLLNPFFLPVIEKFSSLILVVGLAFMTPILVLVVVSMVVRYRSGGFLQRQQVKWLAVFSILITTYSISGLMVYPLLTGNDVMSPGRNAFGMIFDASCSSMAAATIGFAVLRYHLWDIDRIIRRTVAYSILSVIITIIYFTIILTLQTLFTSLFHATYNTLAIVLSTLVIAALFNRLRTRIQSVVDRRFFRKRYDAERILAEFSVTTRREVAIEPIAGELLRSIEETMQPEAASLWLHRAGKMPSSQREA